jgi:hypothetical protein
MRKSIKARLAWRATLSRAKYGKTSQGLGEHSLERIRGYVAEGYIPLWMHKGAVDPWCPKGRWETPSRSQVKDLPEVVWCLWIVDIVHNLESEGRREYFKAKWHRANPYREKILDYACTAAFGTKSPTKEGVYFSHGTMVARMFARCSQGRADTARSLRLEVQDVI